MDLMYLQLYLQEILHSLLIFKGTWKHIHINTHPHTHPSTIWLLLKFTSFLPSPHTQYFSWIYRKGHKKYCFPLLVLSYHGEDRSVYLKMWTTNIFPFYLSMKDPLFSAVKNFSEAASDFHRRLTQVDLNK